MTGDGVTRIILVRHGETLWNRQQRLQGQQNSPLSELGREQARCAGRALDGIAIDAAYVSPLQRAVETINIVLEGRRIEPGFAPGLKEIALGPWEGKTQRETLRTHPREYQAFWQQPERFSLTGAETFKQLQQRVVTDIQKIFERHRNQTILAVTHWIAIKTAIAYFTSTPLNQLAELPNLANGGQLHLISNNQGIRVDDLSLPNQLRLY